MKRKQRFSSQNIIAYVIVGLMAFSLVAVLIVNVIDPDLSTGNVTSPNDEPVDFEITQAPTEEQLPFPVSEINVSQRATQRTGLFQVPLPDGDWSVIASTGNTFDPNENRADLIVRSGERLVIVQTYLELGINYEDTASLSANYLTDSFVSSDWSTEYDIVEVTNRTVSNFFVTLDFNLVSGALTYYGRQISWQEDGNLFNLRLVVPNNNPDLLANLQTTFLNNIVFYPDLLDTPLNGWRAEVDTVFNHMLKMPSNWQILSGESGVPTTYYDPNQDDLLATTQSLAGRNATSLEDAQAVVKELRPSAEITETQAVTQQFADGFYVSYAYPNSDGDRISGAMALFNNGENLSVVELRLPGDGLNLLDATSENAQVVLARQILTTFTVLAPADYVYLEQ